MHTLLLYIYTYIFAYVCILRCFSLKIKKIDKIGKKKHYDKGKDKCIFFSSSHIFLDFGYD